MSTSIVELADKLNAVRVDIAFCDPITHNWYDSASNVRGGLNAEMRIYNAISAAFDDRFGKPITYLAEHYSHTERSGQTEPDIFAYNRSTDMAPDVAVTADEVKKIVKLSMASATVPGSTSNDTVNKGQISGNTVVSDITSSETGNRQNLDDEKFPSVKKHSEYRVMHINDYDDSQRVGFVNKLKLEKHYLGTDAGENFRSIQALFCHYIFTNISSINSMLICPIETSIGGKKYISSFCIISFDTEWTGTTRQVSLLDDLLDEVSKLSRQEITDKLSVYLETNAVNAAKAAIMSRNMSHNLGSHVMYYIKQKLNSARNIFTEREVLQNLVNEPDKMQDMLRSQRCELPFLVGLGRFINYLQERQDYIATIATNYIPSNSTISFKDFVYDELKPDLRYERHKERIESTTDTFGDQPRNLLMDFIAYSEGYDRSDRLRLRFRHFTGHNPVLDHTSARPTIIKGTREAHSFELLRRLNVAFPGGVIGRQAFFSIVENIIRNAAKHSGRRADGYLSIDLDIIEPDTAVAADARHLLWYEGLRAGSKLHKDMSDRELAELYANAANKYHVLVITNNMPNHIKALEGLIESLGDDYVNEEGQMHDRYKGIKEMRISAAWLRGFSIDTLIPRKEPPVIAARLVPVDNRQYTDAEMRQQDESSDWPKHYSRADMESEQARGDKGEFAIQYYICLPKPKKIAYIARPERAIDPEIEKKIMAEGCRVYYYESKNKIKKRNLVTMEFTDTTVSDIADYNVVVLCDKGLDDVVPSIGSRVVPNSSDDSNFSLIGNATPGHVYQLWLNNTFPGNTRLCILDGKSVGRTPSTATDPKGERLFVAETSLSPEEYDRHVSGNVLFFTHYEGQIVDHEHNRVNIPYDKVRFIEGVTGRNSTDRLIRQDEWTDGWLYRHLSAALTRVAIFDERIYSSMLPKVTVGSAAPEALVSQEQARAIAEQMPEETNFKAKKLLREFIKEVQPGLTDDQVKTAIDAAFTKGSSIDDRREALMASLTSLAAPSPKTKQHDYRRAQRYHEMRVWAYNIICPRPSEAVIVGYNAPIEEFVGVYNPEWQATVLGRITHTGTDFEIDLSAAPTLRNAFDFITIHQGLLDKVYTAFGVKDNAEAKKSLTRALFCALSRKFTPPAEGQQPPVLDYLPQFIIHSGRSKPNADDMPQKQPFLQFSAIDSAVRDCKYTLTELLYSAHYEQ